MRQDPKLPEREITTQGLGAVIVRGLGLRARLDLFAEPADSDRAFAGTLLALCVREVNGDQIFGAEGWDAHAAEHFDETLELFTIARELCGFDREATEKK
jgi:hypothetical protein